ncbi:hypothetical protein HDU83_002662 [Entophlyctis luteolus]|nr:hypothetical protein HDU83_002662 [Entophlyctis luteolus]
MPSEPMPPSGSAHAAAVLPNDQQQTSNFFPPPIAVASSSRSIVTANGSINAGNALSVEPDSPPAASAGSASDEEQLVGDETVKNRGIVGRICCGIQWTKRRLIICGAVAVVLLIVFILLLVYVFAPLIAQASINSAVMTLTSTTITSPTNSTFQLAALGTVSNAGFLDATLTFPTAITVYWTNRENAADLELGTLSLTPISVSGGIPKSGGIALATSFQITSADNMGLFAVDMIHASSFSWLLTGTATAQALGMTFNNLNLAKVVTLDGFGGLKNVTVEGFTPSAGANNALAIVVETGIINPSNISIEMGDMYFTFDLGTGVGSMEAANITMKGGFNDLTMNGEVVVPGATGSVSSSISSLGLGSVVTLDVKGDHVVSKNGYVGWLNQAFKSLELNVTMNLTDIAQKSISSADLSLTSTTINQAAETSFHIAASGEATNAGSMDATVSFPNPIDVYWTSRPNGAADVLLGTMPMSSLVVSGTAPKSAPINLDSIFTISDTTAMGEFATYMIQGTSFSWRLIGGATAEAYGLTFPNLSLDKTVTLSGFNSLPNPSVASFDLPDSDSSGIHVVTAATAYNPSTITIEMGTLGFNMAYSGTNIGTLSAPGVTMVPGSNTLSMSGRMYTTNSDLLSTLFSKFLTGNGLNVNVVGTSVTTSSGAQPSWLNTAFQTLNLAVSLPSPSLSQAIVSGLAIPAMTIAFNPSDTTGDSVTVTASTVTANFHNPYAFGITVEQVQTDLQFYDQSSGTAFAKISIPLTSASLSGTTVYTSITGQSLSAIPGQESLFAALFTQITTGTIATVGVKGSVTSVVKTDASSGSVTISGLPLDDSMSFSGFQGLSSVTLTSSAVLGGDSSTGLHLQVGATIKNPSTITLQLNTDVILNALVGGSVIGTVKLSDLSLSPGNNAITTDGYLIARSGDSGSASNLETAMSAYIGGSSTSLTLQGTTSSVPYSSLQSAFAELSIGATLAGQTSALIESGVMSTDLPSSLVGSTITISNPLGAPITINSMTATVSYQTTPIAKIDYTLKNPTTIASGGTATTEKIPLSLILSWSDLLALVETVAGALTGTLHVNIQSTISDNLGTYPNTITYSQNNVPIKLNLLG